MRFTVVTSQLTVAFLAVTVAAGFAEPDTQKTAADTQRSQDSRPADATGGVKKGDSARAPKKQQAKPDADVRNIEGLLPPLIGEPIGSVETMGGASTPARTRIEPGAPAAPKASAPATDAKATAGAPPANTETTASGPTKETDTKPGK
ncbi:MAG TPA: hypothetical protein VI485_03365 [Vicinamibacterales bacterium]|nr:hypothetical protein [Vicinamibacterales bacterium]